MCTATVMTEGVVVPAPPAEGTYNVRRLPCVPLDLLSMQISCSQRVTVALWCVNGGEHLPDALHSSSHIWPAEWLALQLQGVWSMHIAHLAKLENQGTLQAGRDRARGGSPLLFLAG